ncbi:MAG: RNA polymerase sigma-70 factor [Cytophagales bacterium]|nr:RNA polymerase sigma-70 factor [Cytophagales bacterium]
MELDRALAVAIRLGDEKSFEDLVRGMYSSVHFVAKEFVGNAEDAEEVAQDTFLKIWERRRFLDEDANFKGYIFVIARNLALQRLRKRKMNTVGYGSECLELEIKTLEAFDPELPIFMEETRDRVREVVRTMPEQRKKVFTLSRRLGHSHREISTLLNISVRTVESHIYKAMQELKDALAKDCAFY